MNEISVLVVDDHVVFREGLRFLLDSVGGITVVAEASTTGEAVAAAIEYEPDVVLMDLNLPGGGGTEATRQILDVHGGVAILVLTMHADDLHLREAISAGARGYLTKNAEPDAIFGAIRAVVSGQLVFDPCVAPFVLEATRQRRAAVPFPILSEREREILDRMASGVRSEAIAGRLGISLKTVQNNISSIMLKLGARDRAELVVKARDAGLGRR